MNALVILGAATLALVAVADAAPPPVGSDDWKIMEPYARWVATRHDASGRWCCDVADGRPVDARIATGADPDGVERTHWAARVTPGHFDGERDRWVMVPDEKVLREANPTGSAVLWMYNGRVQCFAPPDGG
jgi:hypothetical protein